MGDEAAFRIALSRGRQALAAGRSAEAEQRAGQALAVEPSSVEALVLMARALRSLGRAREALPFARAALAEQPEGMDPALALTDVLIGVRRYDEARSVASGLLTSWPDAWQSHYAWSQAVGAGQGVGRAGRAEATVAADRARTLAPHESRTHNQVGVSLLRQRKDRQAAAAFRAALEQNPHDAMARNNLAVIALRRRGLGRAGRQLSGALATSPHAQVLQRNLDSLVTAISWRLFLVLFVAGRLVDAEASIGASRSTRVVTWAVLMLLLGVVWMWLVRSLPRGYRNPARVFARLGWFDRSLFLLICAIGVDLLVEAVASGATASVAGTGFGVLLWAGVGWVVTAGIRAADARRQRDARAP